MAATASIRFTADSQQARRAIQALDNEVKELSGRLETAQNASRGTGVGINAVAQESQQASRQVRTANTALDALETSMNESRRAALGLRSRMNDLNSELAMNRQRLLTADAAQKELLETRNRAIRVNQGLLRSEQQTNALTLAGLQQQRRELGGLGQGFQVATRGAGVLARAGTELAGTLGAIGIAELGFAAVRFGADTVNAAVKVEGFQNSLTALYGDAQIAERVLDDLREAAQLPGITFEGAVQGAIRLKTVQIEGERANRIITQFGNAAALSGASAEEMNRALVGLTQTVARGQIEQDNLNQILENVPLIGNAIREAFNSIDAETIRDSLDAAGQDVNDFVDILTNQLAQGARASADTAANAFSNFNNASFELKSTLGELLLPTITDVTRGLTGFLNVITDFVDGEDEASSATDEFSGSAEELRARLLTTNNTLEQKRQRLAELSETVTSTAHPAIEQLERQISTLETQSANLTSQLGEQAAEVTTLENPTLGAAAATHELATSVEGLGGAFSQIDTRFLTFHERAAALSGAIRELPSEITAVRTEFDVLAPTAARVNAIFTEYNKTLGRVVATSGVVVTSIEKEQEALDAVTQQFIQATQDAEALAHVQEVVARRTDAHNAALVNPAVTEAARRIREYANNLDSTQLSAEALEETTSASTDRIRDFANQTLTAERVLNNFRGTLGEAEDQYVSLRSTSDRLTDSIRQQASAFDQLRTSVAGVSQAQSGLQGQQLGSGVFDQFNPQTRGTNFGATFGDVARPIAAQAGVDLASQAIQTAGELQRIERDRVQSLTELEEEFSQKIIEINERKRERLADVARQIAEEAIRRQKDIEEAFEDAAEAEVEAREKAAERIEAIDERYYERRERLVERLNERLIALEERRDERIQQLNDGFLEREAERADRILEIATEATEAREQAEEDYADRVQEINNQLVLDVRAVQEDLAEEIDTLRKGFADREEDRAKRIVQIEKDAADEQVEINRRFAETTQDIYNNLVDEWNDLEDGFTERQKDRAREREQIAKEAADAQAEAYDTYAETVQGITNDLVDEVRDIQDEIVEVEKEAQEEREEAVRDTLETLEDIEEDRVERVKELNNDISEIEFDAAEARIRNDQRLADRVEDIQRDLVDEVADIQRELNDTLNDLRDDALEAERDRADSLVELHRDTQERIADIQRDSNRTSEDLRQGFIDDQRDAEDQLQRDLADATSESEREEAIRRFNRRIQDLTQQFHRDNRDLQRNNQRNQLDIERESAQRRIEIAEAEAQRRAELAQQEVDVRAQAEVDTAAAVDAAGVTLADAQANYVPALNAHQQAIADHTAALNAINTAEIADIAEVTQTLNEINAQALVDASEAAATLAENLTAINDATGETVSGLNQGITDAETRTGLTFEQALENYTPAVDLNTQALNTLTETLAEIDTDEGEALARVDDAETADRTATTAAQMALETAAGVTIEDARANYVPALSAAAQATLDLNTSTTNLDTTVKQAITAIEQEGITDQTATDLAVTIAETAAAETISALETASGTTFGEALMAFQPAPDAITQAGLDRDETLAGITEGEIGAINEVNQQSIADRLETDAAITMTRDTYIRARDAEILKHNAAVLKLNTTLAADTAAVKETLDTKLTEIDATLDLELEEIREQKIAFDTKMNELIAAINQEANQDFSALKEDTAQMRVHLEDIAREARDNAWKQAIGKIANVGITLVGTAAGALVGAPQVGAIAGQAVGGLAEQAIEGDLFHFTQTDRIARRTAFQAASAQRRDPYFPTPQQLQNARDVSREIVGGFTEGLQAQATRNGGLSDQLSGGGEADRPVVLQFEFDDGTIQTLTGRIKSLQNDNRAYGLG